MEYVFLGAIVAVWLTTIAVGNQIATQTGILQERLLEIKKALQKDDSTSYGITYDANDIYRLLEDFPERIAQQIKSELGYRRDDVLALEGGISDINRQISDIEKSLFEIQLKIRD